MGFLQDFFRVAWNGVVLSGMNDRQGGTAHHSGLSEDLLDVLGPADLHLVVRHETILHDDGTEGSDPQAGGRWCL